jgi:hypothetical protein
VRGVTRAVNAPDGWVSLLVGRASSVEMLAGVLRGAGLRAAVRDAAGGSPFMLGRDVAVELLVHEEDEAAARRTAEEMNLLGPEEDPDDYVGVGVADPGPPPVAPSDEEPTNFDTDDERDAEASDAMGRLFDTADRLRRHPDDLRPIDELNRAAAVVAGSDPPYGITPAWWQALRDLAAGLCQAVAGVGDDDDISVTAEALRTHLRDYV